MGERGGGLSKERAELAALRSGVAQKQASMDDLRRRAQEDPDGLLAELGVADFLPVAQRAYQRTLGEQAPQELRAAVAQSDLRQRVTRAEAELASVKAEHGKREAAAASQQALERYHADVRAHLGKLDGEAPILKRFFAHSPERTIAALDALQAGHIEEHGELLSLPEIVVLYEASLREELPPDFTAPHKAALQASSSPPAASEIKVAPTIPARDLASPAQPRQRPTREEEDAHYARWLEEYRRTGTAPNW